MSYLVYESSGAVYGAYADLASAQTASQGFYDAYLLANPSLTGKSSTYYYACIKTTNRNRSVYGVTINSSFETVEMSWFIEAMTPPA